MTQFTESQLNAKNKTQVVEIALELDQQLAIATSGPLSAADVQKKVLDLKRQVQTIKDDSKKREQAHKETLAKIEADKEIAIKKLNLEYDSTLGIDAKDLNKAYSDLEERAEKAIKDLTLKLEKAETETNEKLLAIEKQINDATQASKIEIAGLELKVIETKTKTEGEIASIELAHTRKMEQLKYDNVIAIRDENKSMADQVAANFDMILVGIEQYNELKDFVKSDDETTKAKIELAVKQAKSEVYASEGTKYSTLKNSTDSEIALLKNDKAHLTNQVANDAKRIADLETQVKGFPDAIAKAVEAAKSSVTVTQDAGKK